ARRYRLRPRAAHRVALGWTQQQAANHVNAHAARTGLDPHGTATMTGPRLSELENWPFPDRRRPTPQVLALLADVYGTSVHNLVDLDDREQMPPSDLLLVSKTPRTAQPRPEDVPKQRPVHEPATVAYDDVPEFAPQELPPTAAGRAP
nr:helix-turn-helix transcriptional regulator [Micromonospora sp. DSM 115978]